MTRGVVGLLIAAFVAQAAIAAQRDSVTIDELCHVPVGLHWLQTGATHFDPINPPFWRAAMAVPWLFAAPAFAPTAAMGHWDLGYHLMFANADDYQGLFLWPRAVVIATTVLLALLIVAWTTRLAGATAGLVAAGLFAFAPELLAHGHLATVDVAAALGFSATAWAAWRYAEGPTVARAVCVGLALAFAVACKLTSAVLAFVVVVLFGLEALRARRLAPWVGATAVVGLTALVAVNALYGFRGSFAALGSIGLPPEGRLGALAAAAPGLRLPIPAPLLFGIDIALAGHEIHEPTYFLAGELSTQGWWYYHPIAFALKTPLPLLLGALLALAAWGLGRHPARRAEYLFVPALGLFAFNALNPMSYGVRHVLGALPLLIAAMAPLFAQPLERWRAGSRDARTLATVLLVLGLFGWHVAGTLAIAPRYLQYVNELGGGPDQGHRWLIDSNLDWGQDLIRLREYLDESGAGTIGLAYFGRAHPGVYGIDFVAPEAAPEDALVVISASFLVGRPYWMWEAADRVGWSGAHRYAWLAEREPIDRVGALFVFDAPEPPGRP